MTEAIMMAMTMIMILMQTLLGRDEGAKSDQVSEFSSSRHCRSDRTSCAPGKNVKQSKYNDHCDDKHKGHCGRINNKSNVDM